MSVFAPRPVLLFHGDNFPYVLGTRPTCLGLTDLGVDPQEASLPGVVDCSGGIEWPTAVFGASPSGARLYAGWAFAWVCVPLLAEKRVAEIDETGNVWAMNGNQPAGCDPVTAYPYTPAYGLHYDGVATYCGVATGDYRMATDAWHASTHQSMIDMVRILEGAEDWRCGIRSHEYDPMAVPGVSAIHSATRDSYRMTLKAKETAGAEETALFEIEVATQSDFADGEVTEYGGMTRYGDWYVLLRTFYNYRRQTRYYRFRCVIYAGGSIVRSTPWGTWQFDGTTMSDATLLSDGTLQIIRDWVSFASGDIWFGMYNGLQERQEQNATRIRQQRAKDDAFTDTVQETVISLTWDSEGRGPVSYANTFWFYGQLNTVHYLRARYENADGSVVGAWSNVFTLDPAATDQLSTWSTESVLTNEFGSVTPTLIAEEHYTGNETTWTVLSAPAVLDGVTYVLLMKRVRSHAVTPNTWLDSLWCASCDGSTVTLAQIGEDTEDWIATSADLLVADGHLYAGWGSPFDASHLYEWCDLADKEIQGVAIPENVTGAEWAHLAMIAGSPRLICSVDVADASCLAAAELGVELTLYPSIATGWNVIIDPWQQSIWYDDGASNIYWLGNGTPSNAIWYMQI